MRNLIIALGLFAIALTNSLLFSACRPEAPNEPTTTPVPEPTTPVPEVLTTLAKSDLIINDEVQKVCSTNIKKLDRNDKELGNTIKKIITNAGQLNKDKRRSLCADVLSDSMHQNIQTQKVNFAGKQLEYDVVVIGAGVQGSIFNINFLQSHPDAKVLTIDKSAIIAEHFRSKAYRINSPVNRPVGQTNTFPGAPVQLEDFEWFAADDPFNGFPYAKSLWNETVMTNFASHSDFMLGTDLKGIKEETINGHSRYVLELKDFGKIIAKKIVISSGLGVPRFIQGQGEFLLEQLALAEACKYENCLPMVMTFDAMLAVDAAWSSQDRRGATGFKSIIDALDGKTVALVGGGDAGMVAWEYFYLTPIEKLYRNAPPPKSTIPGRADHYQGLAPRDYSPVPSRLIWVGALFDISDPADPAKELINLITKKVIKPRYNNLVTLSILNNLSIFKSDYFPGQRLFSVVKKSDQEVTVKVKTASGEKQFDANYIILTMGYDNDERLMSIVDELLPKSDRAKKWQELFPFFDVEGKRSARQLQTAQGLKDIYLIGTAAGVGGPLPNSQLATQEDIDASITKNAASINVLGPYSARFAKALKILP